MASPQPDKFTRFSNELFDAYIKIARLLSAYENAVWLCIFRNVYGFNQTKRCVSLGQISRMTEISTPNVARTKKSLIKKNMITFNHGCIGIQKDYDKWVLSIQTVSSQTVSRQTVSHKTRGTIQRDNIPVSSQTVPLLVKDNSKDNIKDRGTKVPPSLEEVKSYLLEIKSTVDPYTFFSFYESKGWVVGRAKMKNWHMAVVTWQKREQTDQVVPTSFKYPNAPDYLKEKPDPENQAKVAALIHATAQSIR